MNPLQADFQELYRRHLCRHSQWEINVLHLVAVAGVYFSLFGVAWALPGGRWVVGVVLGCYFATLALNVPVKAWLATLVVVAALLGAFLATPPLPWWIHVALIVGWHRFQVWNHHKYDASYDMSQFAARYRKGPALFFLLAVYELPILLYYLLFDRRPQHARVPV